MRKSISISLLISVLFLLGSCSKKGEATITISNSSDTDRQEITEVSMNLLGDLKDQSFVVRDSEDKEVSYQITYDSLIVFQAIVKAKDQAVYKITTGKPSDVKTIACGRVYPEREDDVAWENDRIAFRTYGPTLQNSGEKAYGYDVWVKNCSDPVVEGRYNRELNAATQKRMSDLRKSDPAAANALADSVSYHIDHGNGMDCYKVGPTLGAGTAALVAGDSIVYPWCYAKQEILDNGPLRFTVRLTYPPRTVGEDQNVVETRLITLDAGTQMNKVVVSYAGLTKEYPIVAGLVIHKDGIQHIDTTRHAMAVAEAPEGNNGRVYVAAIFPKTMDSIEPSMFSDQQKAERGAEGQLLARYTCKPGGKFVYYFGAGWSKWGFSTPNDWFGYVDSMALQTQKRLFTIVTYINK